MYICMYQNIKKSVYCQYGQYSLTFQALALRQRETENKMKTMFYFLFVSALTKVQCSKR